MRLRDLVLLNVSAVVGVRWLSAAGHAGPGSLTLFLLAALFFFLPCARVVAALSKRFPEEGGLYIWTKHAFGDWHGFLCAYFYCLSNLVFFPTLLLAGVSMSSYIFGPAAASFVRNTAHTIPITLGALWLAFLANLFGLKIGKWTGNLGGICTYTVVALLAVFGAVVAWKSGSATEFHLTPEMGWDNLNLWSQIAFSFIGLELGAILGGEIRDPERTIPRAAWISCLASVAFYVTGTAAMLVLMKPADISVLEGLAQAGRVFGLKLGLWWISPCFALLIALGVFGQVGAYITGISRLPYSVGLDRHLPPAFARIHPRWQTPYVSILVQGAAATVFLVTLQLGETLQSAYQTLVDMCVITGFFPFLYIFASAYRFGHKLSAVSGIAVSAAAILLSLSPPPGIHSPWIFEAKLIGGFLFLAWIGRLLFSGNTSGQRTATR